MLDLNCDMGEGFAQTERLVMPCIDSANISCGAHAGTWAQIKETIRWARDQSVKIGAHPGYADKPNFGRTPQNLPERELKDLIKSQLETFINEVTQQSAKIHHVKLHGALYNQTAQDPKLCETVLIQIQELLPQTIIYGLPNSFHEKVANQIGLEFWGEGFLDRTYQSTGKLTPRTEKDALITEPEKSLAQAREIIHHQRVWCIDSQTWLPLQVKTLCVHGDSEAAVALVHGVLKV